MDRINELTDQLLNVEKNSDAWYEIREGLAFQYSLERDRGVVLGKN